MRVEFSKRAQRSIERIDARWRKNAERRRWLEVLEVWDGRRKEIPKLQANEHDAVAPGTPTHVEPRRGLRHAP